MGPLLHSQPSSATLSFRRERGFKAISSDARNESDDARVTNSNCNRRRREDSDDDDARRERTSHFARNKTIDLKRENVYALVHVRARMSSSSSTMRRKRTSGMFGQSEHVFTEILRNALELARGKVGGKDIMDATRVVHFETKKESEGESAIGAVRMKRKDLELFASAVKEYDALYSKKKTNDSNNRTEEEDSIGLRIEVLRAANSLLDMVGVESERDMVDALLLNE